MHWAKDPIAESQLALHKEIQRLNLEVVKEGFIATLEVKSNLEGPIRTAQREGKYINKIKDSMKRSAITEFFEDMQGTIWYRKRLVVPNNKVLKELILRESHETPYTIHPENTKMYQDI